MAGYFPNEGEILLKMAGLAHIPLTAALYRNAVPADGGITYTSFTKLTTGGGRLYADKSLDNAVNMTAMTLDQWYMTTNASGRAESKYKGQASYDYVEWTFNSVDVADGYSVYGIFNYATIIPFDAGARVNDRQPMVGDSIVGLTSAAYAEIVAIVIFSGSFLAGTAAGWLVVKGQSGTFVNDENLVIKGEIQTLAGAPTVAGTGYAVGDIFKITTGGIEGLGIVQAEAGGIPSNVVLVHGGRGYTTGTGKATAKITGGGDNALTVNISAIDIATAYVVSNTGTLFAGDSHKKVIVMEPLTTAQAVSTTVPIRYTPILQGSTG